MTGKNGSKNPSFPDAYGNAPGGMSRKGLIEELVKKHGFEDDAPAWAKVAWPVLIEMVIEERVAREKERPEPDAPVLNPMTDDVEIEDEFAEHALAPDEMPNTDEMFDDLPYEPDELDVQRQDAKDLVDSMFPPLDPDEEITEVWTKVHEDFATAMEQPLDESVFRAETDTAEMFGDAPDDSDEEMYLDPETLFAEMAQARDEHEASLPAPLFLGMPGVEDYVFDGHAGAGPSGAERWASCTMSLSASRRFLETLTPNQQRLYAESSTAARQGTTAHAVGEIKSNLALGRIEEDEAEYELMALALTPLDGEEYDEEMGDYVDEYVELINSYASERGADAILVESRVEAAIPLTNMHEGETYVIRGSADAVALPTPEHPELVVGDLKYGEGKDVTVDENPQIRLYALGVLSLLPEDVFGATDTVVYHIIQPRLGGIKTWTESIEDLLAWRDEVLAPALTLALYGEDEGATFNPSELACQWCPARGGCPALAESRVAAAVDLFTVVADAEHEAGPGAFPETTTLSNQRLGELLAQASGVVDLLKEMKEEAQRRLFRGVEVPGFQLVNYTPRREWKATAHDKIAEGLKDLSSKQRDALFTEPKLVTPAQAEKLLGPEVFPKVQSLIIAPDKRPVVAKEGDRRTPWGGTPPEQMFPDDLPTEEG